MGGKRETTNNHHRKPRCLGGRKEPRNMVRVNIKRHQSWTNLFTCLTPEEIVEEINTFLIQSENFRFVAEKICNKNKIDKISNKETRFKKRGRLSQQKRYFAWNFIFHGMTPEEIAKEINEVWIDPDYELKIERKN